MSTTLPLFWHLSSASKKERIDASVKLVGALEQFQAQFVPKEATSEEDNDDDEDGDEEEEEEDGGGDVDSVKKDGLDALNAQDVSYSIRRLVRGLASPRESSRLGFAVALTELLSRIETVTCSQIVSLILDSSKTAGSMSGQEERDLFFARLFGLTAVIQSGLLVRQQPLPTSTAPASSLSGFQDTVRELLVLADKKSWLRESACWTIALAIDKLRDSAVDWKEAAGKRALELIFVENKNWSPEKVALALKLQKMHPGAEWRKLLAPPFKHPELLSTANLSTLARILKESTADDEDGDEVPKTTTALWKPQVHFVWDILLDEVLPGPNSTASPKGSFQEFFRIVVDESLFSSNASPEKKYWGFQVFQKALLRVTAEDMPMLFTKNFMRSWINHLSNKDRHLHKAARQVATEIQAFVQKNPNLGFSLILQLTGVHGNTQFDKLTKTKTIESILASMDAEGISNYIDCLLKQVNEVNDVEGAEANDVQTNNDVQTINARRAWVLDQLAALVRNTSIPKSDAWIQSILDWLVVNGLFAVKKASSKSSYLALRTIPVPAFSDELRQSCRTRLLGSLADLTSQTSVVKVDGDKAQKVAAAASDGEFWVSKVLSTIEVLESDAKHVKLLADVEEEDAALREKARKVASQLKNTPSEHREVARGAELLLSATLLQQYCADDSEDDADSEALESCIDGATRMFPSKKSKKSRKSTGGDADMESAPPEPIDVLVDTIIGFLEKSTAYMRTVSNQVFSLLSSSVKETTIDLILTQLERRDPGELGEDEEGSEMDEDADEDDDGSEDGSEDASEEDVDDDDDSADEDGDPELRSKIQEALRINGMEAASDNSDEESEEELMDDDQMMAIDGQLAAVFRARANEKRTVKDTDAHREATHFKNRVLDLVDTYIKRQPSSPHLVRLILPLVELIVGTGSDERQLSDKATGILKNRIGKLKETPASVGVEQVTQVLDDLHTRARKVHASDLMSTLSQCSLYLSRLLLHADGAEAVARVYRLSLVDFVTRKGSALNGKFFEDFIRRHPGTAWTLRDDLVDVSGKAVNAYRQCQTFQLLQALLSQRQIMDDHPKELLKFMSALRQALHKFLSGACDSKATLTAPQVKELLKFALAAVRQTKRLVASPEELPAIWNPSSWDALRRTLAAHDRFKASTSVQTLCQQIVQALDTSAAAKPKKEKADTGKQSSKPAPAGKRKAGDVSGDEATKKTKRKKVHKEKA
ncbi:hypothetical protein PLICRDRAFT_108863 [Plicaturopsis crispa FD-325 SS-3]|nr:hypothetical protein PLICRDRAFT_108863 [Plicaturopsis crispa FD-325 SS-3]